MAESRGPTISDWMAVVVGIAVCLAVPARTAGYPYVAVLYLLQRLLACVLVGVAFAVIIRQLKFRRKVDPAEWFVLLLATSVVATLIPNVDTTLDAFHWRWSGTPLTEKWTVWRWSLAGVVTLIAIGAVILAKRYTLPACLRTVLVLTAAVAMFWGPLSVFAAHFNLPRSSPVTAGPSLPDEVFLETRNAIRRLPFGLLFGVAAAATLLTTRRERSRWPWTCWASAVCALLSLCGLFLAGTWSVVVASDTERAAWIIVRPLWLVMITSTAVALARKLRAKRLRGSLA